MEKQSLVVVQGADGVTRLESEHRCLRMVQYQEELIKPLDTSWPLRGLQEARSQAERNWVQMGLLSRQPPSM